MLLREFLEKYIFIEDSKPKKKKKKQEKQKRTKKILQMF